MTVELRPYQIDALEAFSKSAWQRSLIVLSTGMGKTITGLAIAKQRGGRCLWLAHRQELIDQPGKALSLVWPGVENGIVKAEKNQFMRHVVFASIQSAQQEKRSEELARQNFSLVVVDEAHRASSPGYKELLEKLGCWRDGGPRLLGLTATPERSDNVALDDIFQGIVFQVGITTAIDGGYLVPPRVVERSINVDLDAVTVARGDFGQKQLDLALMQAGIVNEVCAAYEENCSNKKTLVFMISVEQAEKTAAELRARGVRAAAVSGETPREQRRSILKKLNIGELSCVVNCMVLTEGFDEPSVDALILARPTQSKPLMIQMVGRGLRLFPGKSECLVVDLVGASKRHTLIHAAVLFGVKKEEPRGGGTSDLEPNSEEFWRQRILSQIKGVRGSPRAKLRWLDFKDGDKKGWMIVTDLGTIRMREAIEDKWLIDVVTAEGRFIRLSDVPVTLEYAQAISEDYIRRVEATTNASQNHFQPVESASAKQIAYLRRRGVKIREGITKREAGRIIGTMRG